MFFDDNEFEEYDDYQVSNCELIGEDSSHNAYIPSKFAKIGTEIIIKNEKFTVGKINSEPISKKKIDQINKQNLRKAGYSSSNLDLRFY